MAAVLAPRPARTDSRPAHRPPSGPARPRLVVLEGGRSPRRVEMARRYRRRRALVATVAVVVLLAGWWLAGALGSGGNGSGDVGSTATPVAATRFVAQPGDTLWSMALALDVGGDVRDTVDRLAEHNDTVALVPGQVVEVPADLRR